MKTNKGFAVETEVQKLARLACAASNALTAAQDRDASADEIAALEAAEAAAQLAWNNARLAAMGVTP